MEESLFTSLRNSNKTEGVEGFKIFPSHFNCIICGKPGSGKTTLLKYLLRSDGFFYKKFDYIICLSPSIVEFKDLFISKIFQSSEFSCDWIMEKLQFINSLKFNKIDVLLIIDDFVSQMDKNKFDEKLTSIAFNRRHLLDNGILSIIQTTQKYNVIPTRIRCCFNVLILFNCNKNEILTIEKELIFDDVDFQNICKNNIVDGSFLIYNINSGKFYKNFDIIN
jgi:hypothetical protein